MKTWKQKNFEAISQLLCVNLVGGDSDEMLSSYAFRMNHWMEPWLNWLFGNKNHCRDAFLWERDHYNVDRFK